MANNTPVEDKRIYELEQQDSLLTNDFMVFDNEGLAIARKISRDDLVASIQSNLAPSSPLVLAQDPPVDEDWRPIVVDGAAVAPPVGDPGVVYEVDVSAYTNGVSKGVFLLAFLEETGGAAAVEMRVSPIDLFPTGVIVGTAISSALIVTTFTALTADQKFYLRLISSGGVPATVNFEVNFLAAI